MTTNMTVKWIVPALLLCCHQARAQRSVILISIDGMRPDYVLEAESHGLRIPNLRRFAAGGEYATGVRGVTPTLTYPSHTTILTGVSPSRHGIYANTTFDPLNKNDKGWYWYGEDIRVPTLWSLARDAGYVTANVHWPVSVGAPVTWNLPQLWRTGTPDDAKLLRALSTPGLITGLESKLGPYADGMDESVAGDEKRSRFAVALILAKKPRFATVYFTGLDTVEHEHGPFSPEANAALERIDKLIGDVRKAGETAAPDSVTCVISDHGFARTTAEVNLFVPFVNKNLLEVKTGGAVTNWSATVWPAGASAAVVLKDGKDARVRGEVEKLLTSLAADPGSGIDRIVGAAELKQWGGFPDAAWLVNLKPGFQLGYALSGPLVTSKAAPGGMHGYLPSSPEMRSAFFIIGPGIGARSLGEIRMQDIAPTLARILGLRFREIEGHELALR